MSNYKSIKIKKPLLFSFEECLWYLDRNFDDCMYRIQTEKILKAIEVNNTTFICSISSKNGYIDVEILDRTPNEKDTIALKNYATEWFDLDRDIQPFYEQLDNYPILSHLKHDYTGLRIMGISDLFEALCWSIIGQQINLTFAYTLKRRLVEKYGLKIEHQGENYYIFPSCEVLTKVKIEDLRAMQFSQKKAEYIIGVAQLFSEGKMSKQILQQLPDFESQQKALIEIKGIGVWTANYVLMKTLRASSAIPYGDAGLLKALENYNLISNRQDRESIDKLFNHFKGWESYLVFYLWRTLSKKL